MYYCVVYFIGNDSLHLTSLFFFVQARCVYSGKMCVVYSYLYRICKRLHSKMRRFSLTCNYESLIVTHMRQITLRFNDDDFAVLAEKAKRDDRSVNYIFSHILRLWVESECGPCSQKTKVSSVIESAGSPWRGHDENTV